MTTFTERNVYGGISEDDNIGEGKVLFAENLDLTTSSNFYTISQKPKIEQITTNEITCIFEAGDDLFFCDEDRNLYKLGNSTPVWTEEIILSTWTTSEWLYMIDASEDIHRISLSNISETDWSTFVETTDTTIPTTSADIFTIADEDVTYIGVGNKVYRVNNEDGVIESENTFTISSEVRGLSQTESRVEIFTEGGKYIIWDGIAGGSIRTKDLGVKIGFVINIGSDNYIVSGGSIYRLNGYEIEQLFYDTYSDILGSTKYDIRALSKAGMDYLEDIFYVGVEGSVDLDIEDYIFGDSSILTIGTKKSGFPQARNLFISRVLGKRIGTLDYLYTRVRPFNSFGKALYFGYSDVEGNYGLASIVLGNQNEIVGDNGILIYKTFDGLEKEQSKQLNEVKVRADMPNTDCSLYLCFLKDGQLEWAGGTKENSKRVAQDIGPDGLYSFFIDELKQDFFDITPALILEQKGTYLRRNAIKVYSLTYIYNDNNDERR